MAEEDTLPEKIVSLHLALVEARGTEIAYATLAEKTGYTEKTLRTYVGKNKLAPDVVPLAGGKGCRVAPGFEVSLGELRRRLSQRANRYTWEHLGVSELVSNLLDRSRTNAGLALELINRPEMSNRVDAFVLLFVTAWEQLLKAALERREPQSIFTGEKSASGRDVTISLGRAIERHYPQRKDPVRLNLEKLKDLRDGAAHLLVPEVTGILTRYFQSSILNYISEFQKIAEEAPFRFEGTGLLTLGVAYQSPTIEALRVRHGPYADEVKALISDLENDASEANDRRFAIGIEYSLVLEKKAGAGAIHLVNDPAGTRVRTVKVPRDPREVCPHNATEVAQLVSERTGKKWSANDVAIVADFMGVKASHNEFHFSFRAGKKLMLHTYSSAFVDEVVRRLRQTPDLLRRARDAQTSRRR